jgi:hypothetical protein
MMTMIGVMKTLLNLKVTNTQENLKVLEKTNNKKTTQ